MARRRRSFPGLPASVLCGIAVFYMYIAVLVFLHKHRPWADVSTVEPNIDDSNHTEERRDSAESILKDIGRIAASKRSQCTKSFGQQRSDFCSNVTRDSVGILSSADEMTEETFQWQTVDTELNETFVFSAYYDRRFSPAVVLIIGISSGKYVGAEGKTKHCQLWLPNEMHPKVTLVEYMSAQNARNRSYVASLHICRLENVDDIIPYAVSLVNDGCQSPSNVLRVLNYNDLQSPEVNFTVCVTPLSFNYNNYHQLVEMVEVNRLFGAQRFVFYNYSTGIQLEPYIRWYESRAVLRVIPWHLPVVVDVWPHDPKVEPEIHYFGQLAALNDCLYRNMLSSHFVVFTDLDELIVPRRHDNWFQMLGSIIRTHKQQQKLLQKLQQKKQRQTDSGILQTPGAFVFRNVFFRTDWKNRPSGGANYRLALGLKLNTLLKTIREDLIYGNYPSFGRWKLIAVAQTVWMVGVHSVRYFIDVNLTHVMVDADQGLLHHYRLRIDEYVVTPVADDRMQHFAKKIISAVNYVHGDVLRHSKHNKSK